MVTPSFSALLKPWGGWLRVFFLYFLLLLLLLLLPRLFFLGSSPSIPFLLGNPNIWIRFVWHLNAPEAKLTIQQLPVILGFSGYFDHWTPRVLYELSSWHTLGSGFRFRIGLILLSRLGTSLIWEYEYPEEEGLPNRGV